MRSFFTMKRSLSNKIFFTPLPVLVVATYDPKGVPDAMNAAWAGLCGSNNISLNLDSEHKTTKNIRHNGVFTVSFATVDTLKIADYVRIVSANKISDKLAIAGIHTAKAPTVNAPVIDEFPLTMECRVQAITEEFGKSRIIAEVVNMISDESILTDDGKIDLGKLRPITFDSEQLTYREIGENIGIVYQDGKKLFL